LSEARGPGIDGRGYRGEPTRRESSPSAWDVLTAALVMLGVVLSIAVGSLLIWTPLRHSGWVQATISVPLGLLWLGHKLEHILLEDETGSPATRFSQGLIGLAASIAGSKRPTKCDEWRAHLAGETGHDPVTWQKVNEALRFVASAVRLRLGDAADAAWTPFDAILKSRTLSNLVVLGPTGMAAVFILRQEGTLGVIKSAGSISVIGSLLYGVIRLGRWWRDVKPPEPKARRAKE
jgi:hypothetical protein